MASLTFTDFGQAASAAFLGDYSDRDHILPGGAQLAVAASWSGLTDNIVPAGTLVGRTTAEQQAGNDFGPAADADDEVFILAEDVSVAAGSDRGANLVRHGSVIKSNFLPSFAGASATLKAKLQADYTIVLG